MNEPFLFYWPGWLIIIIVYFFIDENKAKYFFLYTMFLIILLIDVNVSIFGEVNISASFIVLFISSLLYYATLSFSYYDLFVTITVIFGYMASLIWGKIAPIWFVIHPQLMIPLFIGAAVIILCRTFQHQIATVMISLTIGQFLFGLIVISYRLHEYLVEQYFFTMLFILILFLLVIQLFTLFIRFLKMKITF